MFENLASSLYSLPAKASAYVLKGKDFVCTDNLNEELKFHDLAYQTVQNSVTDVKERFGEEKAQEFYDNVSQSTWGEYWIKSKECLDSLGYNLEELPTVVVPEFDGLVGAVAATGIAGVVIASKYLGSKLGIGKTGRPLSRGMRERG